MPPVPFEQCSPYGADFTASIWMTTAQCARYRNCSESTLNKERVAGTGPPFLKIRGRMVRYDRRVVDEWLQAQTRCSTSDPPRAAEAPPTPAAGP
jgi:predicted DNA-binding transcriptional regulator AlpA